jgi:hypothetical protein
MRTSQNVSIELTWAIDIVRVVARAGEEAKILLAPHGSANALIVHGPLPPINCALNPLAMIRRARGDAL